MEQADEPNILLVIVDCLRAHNVSCYGYQEETTPFLDSFAEENVRFSQARAPGTWSLPSHASMFTGQAVHKHGLTSRDRKLEPNHTIWETLSSKGYKTGVFTPNPFITMEQFGLQRGFHNINNYQQSEHYPFRASSPGQFCYDESASRSKKLQYIQFSLEQQKSFRALMNGLYQFTSPKRVSLVLDRYFDPHNQSQYIVNDFVEWTESIGGPWAACLNLCDTHEPYLPVPEYDHWGSEPLHNLHNSIDDFRWDFYSDRRSWGERAAFESLYNGCIRQVDSSIKKLISRLKANGEYENTYIVITSDHGEGFGEYSRVNHNLRVASHRVGAHEALFHVPLIIKPIVDNDIKSKEPLSEVTTLTQFHDSVESVLSGSSGIQEFCAGGAVTAGANYNDLHTHLQSDEYEAIQPYRDDIDLDIFKGKVHVLYESFDDIVRKFVVWGENEATIHIHDINTAEKVASSVPDRIYKQMDVGNDSVDLTTENPGDVSEAVEDKLQALGYK